jgi:hypothetical protein
MHVEGIRIGKFVRLKAATVQTARARTTRNVRRHKENARRGATTVSGRQRIQQYAAEKVPQVPNCKTRQETSLNRRKGSQAYPVKREGRHRRQ